MRTSAALVVALSLGACQTDREGDCERVYAILDASKRHRYDPKAEFEPHAKLKTIQFRDREISEAVSSMLSPAGWTLYTPYSTEPPPPPNDGAIRLSKLCERHIPTI